MAETDITTHVIWVAGLVKKGSKILLAQRSLTDPQSPGEWSIPGGKVDLEVGDSVIEQTLAREVFEETGVKIRPEVIYLGSDAFIRISGHHVIGLTFLCYYSSGRARPLEDQENVAWFTLAELEKMNLPKYLRKRITFLKNYFKTRSTSGVERAQYLTHKI